MSTLHTALVACFVEALLRTSSFPRVCRVLGVALVSSESVSSDSNPPSPWEHGAERRSLEASARIHDEVRRVYEALPLPDTCLRRCLTAGHRLRSDKPRLMIGVRRRDTLQAHAWLMVGSEVLDWADKRHDYTPIRAL